MRELVHVDPEKWLRGTPIAVAAAQDVLRGFDRTKPMAVMRFKGPHEFYRTAGWDETKGKMADPYGCWWIDETALTAMYSKIGRLDMFEGWMTPDVLARIKSLPLHYRALAAICEDWNDFREQLKLILPQGEELTGLCGTVAPQPLKSTMSRTFSKTAWLPGGSEQLFFKRGTASERNINPLWVHWINLW